MTDCLIAQTKRTRVGGTGPRRNKLLTHCKLGDAPERVVDELNYILDTHSGNDIGGDDYGISQNCEQLRIEFDTEDKYRQVLMQKKALGNGDDVDEYLYTEWDHHYLIRYTHPYIQTLFNNVYRFRLSEMKGDHELSWHIDADTSVICRAQICLSDSESLLEFRDKAGVHKLQMKKGEVWFINTGWNHRVVNGSNIRRSAIWGFHYDDLKDNGVLNV